MATKKTPRRAQTPKPPAAEEPRGILSEFDEPDGSWDVYKPDDSSKATAAKLDPSAGSTKTPPKPAQSANRTARRASLAEQRAEAERKKQRRRSVIATVSAIAISAAIVVAIWFGVTSRDDSYQRTPARSDQWRTAPAGFDTGLVGVSATPFDRSRPERVGGGIFVTTDASGASYFVTPYHLVAETTDVRLGVIGKTALTAQVVGFDLTKNLAVLRVPSFTDTSPARLSSYSAKKGDELVVLRDFHDGGPLQSVSLLVTLTSTYTSVYTDDADFGQVEGLFGLDLPEERSMGGEVVSSPSGDEVYGFVVWRDYSDRFLALPAGEIAPVVQTVMAGKDSGTVRVGPAGDLGLTTQKYDSTVHVVDRYGPAGQSGIRPGDQIVMIGNASFGTFSNQTPESVIRMLEPGTSVEVTWRPADGTGNQTVTLIVTERTTN